MRATYEGKKKAYEGKGKPFAARSEEGRRYDPVAQDRQNLADPSVRFSREARPGAAGDKPYAAKPYAAKSPAGKQGGKLGAGGKPGFAGAKPFAGSKPFAGAKPFAGGKAGKPKRPRDDRG
jgi:ATP-dependent RNA helicase DeaD